MSNKPKVEQLSLFSKTELTAMKQPKRLFALVVAKEGHSWWQEIPRIKGLTPWQTAVKYRKESLGSGYWIEKCELRY